MFKFQNLSKYDQTDPLQWRHVYFVKFGRFDFWVGWSRRVI